MFSNNIFLKFVLYYLKQTILNSLIDNYKFKIVIKLVRPTSVCKKKK